MFIDARRLAERDTLDADLCVIGAGAAGIPIAREFAGMPARVVLLEGGGLAPGADGRGIYAIVHAPTPGLVVDPSRTGYFGGNTNHWFGNCSPLEAADFEHRDWIPHSGWAVDRHQLMPFYERAQAACGVGAFRYYDVEACGEGLAPVSMGMDPTAVRTRVVQTAPEPSFGARYAGPLGAAENVIVSLGARADRLVTNARGDAVRAVEAASPNGRRLRVSARVFVLAAGGVENARLLLASNDASPGGLGNGHDLVGRFFMDHPYVDIPLGGWAPGHPWAVHNTPQPIGDAVVWPQLALSDERLRRERLPGIRLWLHAGDRSRALSVDAARRVGRLLLGGARPGDVLTEIRMVLSDPGALVRSAASRLRGRAVSDARPAACTLRVAMEQTPDPENRVVVSAGGAGLVYRLTEEDRRRHGRALRIAAGALGLDGRRLERQLRLLLRAGRVGSFWHHMGATRMHPDPRHGVVDADCRVHGVSNLFVAGSSVFPTGGTAAPTLTIVALALRLADHLRAHGL